MKQSTVTIPTVRKRIKTINPMAMYTARYMSTGVLLLFIVWSFVGVVLGNDVLTSVVEGSRVLLDIVIDSMVEVAILLVVPVLHGGCTLH